AQTPEVPYYAVIFTSVLAEDDSGYEQMAQKMVQLAEQQAGFIGIEGAREGLGITVSYWQDLESIKKWKNATEHQIAQKYGKEKWYAQYSVRVAKVERQYGQF
ncbi:MAG: antibiotic biosynthesis monooxygenase, partial [Gammaproteobacteria bacterium]|nr:antibiotic biosynthesis monooxygenase [Gammaproteobacteria bacterium]